MTPWLNGWLDNIDELERGATGEGGFETLQSITRGVVHNWAPLTYATDSVSPLYKLDPAPLSVRPGGDMSELLSLLAECDTISGSTPEIVAENELFSVVRHVQSEDGLHGQELQLSAEQVDAMVRVLKLNRNDAAVVAQLHPFFESDRKSGRVDQAGHGPKPWLFKVTRAHAPTIDQLLSSSYLLALESSGDPWLHACGQWLRQGYDLYLA